MPLGKMCCRLLLKADSSWVLMIDDWSIGCGLCAVELTFCELARKSGSRVFYEGCEGWRLAV